MCDKRTGINRHFALKYIGSPKKYFFKNNLTLHYHNIKESCIRYLLL